MTNRPQYPKSLFLPPEAFAGYNKYLNIFGTDHVCDGEDYVEYVRVGVTRGIETESRACVEGLPSPRLKEGAVDATLIRQLNAQIKRIEAELIDLGESMNLSTKTYKKTIFTQAQHIAALEKAARWNMG